MAVTLSDVAKKCRVDISTVSRALRDDERVKPDTRERVKKAASRVGYVPNLAARNLAAGKTRTIWFIVPSFDNPQEREPVQFASQYLGNKGYDLMAGLYHHEPDIYARVVGRMQQGVADGAIIIPGGSNDDGNLYRPLREKKIPLVFLDRHPESVSAPVVTTDNRNSAGELVKRCAAEGVESCILIFGEGNPVEKARRDGALAELGKRRIPVLVPEDGRIPEEAVPALLDRVMVLGNQQGPLLEFMTGNSAALKKKKLYFGVFDGWTGEPNPAEKVFVCLQDFKTMAETAADRVLGMIEGKEKADIKIEMVPALAFKTIERKFQEMIVGICRTDRNVCSTHFNGRYCNRGKL